MGLILKKKRKKKRHINKNVCLRLGKRKGNVSGEINTKIQKVHKHFRVCVQNLEVDIKH